MDRMSNVIIGRIWLMALLVGKHGVVVFAQSSSAPAMVVVKEAVHTPVKNQAKTGTCWSFSTTSLIESEAMRVGLGAFDLSEMYTVRNIYLDKAKNYVLRQGIAQFGEGGLGHDVIRSISRYGAMPEFAYSGLVLGNVQHDHRLLEKELKTYLDSLLSLRPLPANWMADYEGILDKHLGKVPETFVYSERHYTPVSFAKEVLNFREEDYLNITSFSHHPYYTSFVLEVPDNFSNGIYHNVPLEDMISLAVRAIEKGYSVMWDADVSNESFRQQQGFALQLNDQAKAVIDPDDDEVAYSQPLRQELFENLTTQDDHLMHLVGLVKSPGRKRFFRVKNSWGEVGPFKGFINVSEAYFAINTISLVVPKAAIDTTLLTKLGIK